MLDDHLYSLIRMAEYVVRLGECDIECDTECDKECDTECDIKSLSAVRDETC